MRDHIESASISKVLSWTAVAFLALFPVLAVNATSSGMRLGWIFILTMFIVLGLSAHSRTKSNAELRSQARLLEKSSYARRYRPVITGIMLSTLVAAEVLAITATYAAPERPLIWHGTTLIAQWGEAIFPIVGKYATQIKPSLAPQILFKAQAVTTLFLVAGAVMFLIYVPYLIFMPRRDTRVIERMTKSMGYGISPTMNLLMLPLGVLVGAALFSGWLEFSSDPESVSRKRQFIMAVNYVQDDLALIVAGFIRIFGSFGAWLGALSCAITAISSDAE